MIDISAHPLCAARLKFQRCNLAEPGFTKFWAAVCVAEDFSDVKLSRFGGFDFSDRSEANGDRLLARLESFIKSALATKAELRTGSGKSLPAVESSIRSFLGANGVKVSKLRGPKDYQQAAAILWRDHIAVETEVPSLDDLRSLIARIPRKQRSKGAKTNLSKLPLHWRAR